MADEPKPPSIDEIRARWARATPGPWEHRPWNNWIAGPDTHNERGEVDGGTIVLECNVDPGHRNVLAIASAPTDIAALIGIAEDLARLSQLWHDRYDRRGEELDRLKAQLASRAPRTVSRSRHIHMCLSVDIDRFSDSKLEREYMQMFREQKGFETVAQIRAYCAEGRAKGWDAFPPCDNADERGHCMGHGPTLHDLERELSSEASWAVEVKGSSRLPDVRKKLARLCHEYLDLMEAGDGSG